MEETIESDKLRCFIAISPGANIVSAISDVQNRLRRHLTASPIRWTGMSQWHLTLRFLGAIESAQLPAVIAACQAIAEDSFSFSLILSRLGSFPPRRSPRVLWLGVKEDAENLRVLHQEIQIGTATIGNPPDAGRDFHPHITLARIKNASLALPAWESVVRDMGSLVFESWQVDAFHLVRSHLSPAGASYETLQTFHLKS